MSNLAPEYFYTRLPSVGQREQQIGAWKPPPLTAPSALAIAAATKTNADDASDNHGDNEEQEKKEKQDAFLRSVSTEWAQAADQE